MQDDEEWPVPKWDEERTCDQTVKLQVSTHHEDMNLYHMLFGLHFKAYKCLNQCLYNYYNLWVLCMHHVHECSFVRVFTYIKNWE